jgi:hypothetical protein
MTEAGRPKRRSGRLGDEPGRAGVLEVVEVELGSVSEN